MSSSSNQPNDGNNPPPPEAALATEEDSFDAQSSLPSTKKREPRTKSNSDLSEMTHGKVRASRKDRRTVSDMVLFASLPEEVKVKRQRMKSSSDVIERWGMNIGQEDLRYAEEIAALGTRRERIASGISDMVVKEKIEDTMGEGGGGGGEEEEFQYNHEGLTTAEAERLLAIHGKNALPEKVDPKWLIMFRILTQPMVCSDCSCFVCFVLVVSCFLGCSRFLPLFFLGGETPLSGDLMGQD